MSEPRQYAEILRQYRNGHDYSVTCGNHTSLPKCLLIAPHGGKTEPGTSEILHSVAALGEWAWYDFAGMLPTGNRRAFHLTSTDFDEPTLLDLLGRTSFVVSIHGAGVPDAPVVYVGGRWELGRQALTGLINAATREHGIRAYDAVSGGGPRHLHGTDLANITNRGMRGEGVQLEFSRRAREYLFPPKASPRARRNPSAHLVPLAKAIDEAIRLLCGVQHRQPAA